MLINLSKFMQISFKNKLLINLAVTLGAVVILVVANVLVSSNISKKLGKIQEYKRELSLRAEAIESLVILKKDSEVARSYANFLENLFPDADAIISFRRDLQSLASRHKMSFTFSFLGESSAKEGQLGSIGFQMSVGGKPEVFLDFLKDLELINYIINFDAIDFGSAPKAFTARFAGKVFIK